jgi:hypothetical protein
MTKVDKGSILNGFHGRLNDFMVVKQRNGKTIVCFYPQGQKVKWTENQKARGTDAFLIRVCAKDNNHGYNPWQASTLVHQP